MLYAPCIREGDIVRAKSNRVREGTGRRFQGRRKGKEKSFCFVVVQFELIFGHPCFYVVCACIEFFGEVGHFTERSGFLQLCHPRKADELRVDVAIITLCVCVCVCVRFLFLLSLFVTLYIFLHLTAMFIIICNSVYIFTFNCYV